MWAQMITTRLKAGHEGDLPRLMEQLQAVEQPGSGLVRSTAMRDQKDPSKVYMFVLFESEEAARARENARVRRPDRGRGVHAVVPSVKTSGRAPERLTIVQPCTAMTV
jgi:quinol monooxygenase YgiN